jgi:hypothetical protein
MSINWQNLRSFSPDRASVQVLDPAPLEHARADGVRRMWFRPVFAVAGALLIAAAVLMSSPFLEQALTGRANGLLRWGPDLFRVMLALHGCVLIAATFLPQTLRAAPHSMRLLDRRAVVIIGALSIVGIALRIPGLNSCLWLDEVTTLLDFARPSLAQIVTSFPNQNQHMLFSILAHASMRVFGESAWALRLPSVAFGIASIWALYLLGARVLGRREAYLACALMTFSYHHVWFSQNARGYMGVLFFATLATYIWLELLDHPSWFVATAYPMAAALGIWVHMTMVFVVAGHALVSAVLLVSARQRTSAPAILAAFFLTATFTLQLHALSLPEFLSSARREVSMPSEWTNPLWVIAESLRSLKIGFAGAFVLFCAAALVIGGWASILLVMPHAAVAMALSFVLGGVSMLTSGHNLWPRFFFFGMGFVLLIVIHGAVNAPLWIARLLGHKYAMAAKIGFGVASAIILASLSTVPRCYALPKQDFIGARDYVRRYAPDSAVATVGLASNVYGRYYAPGWAAAESVPQILEARTRGNAFLVYTLPIELKAFHPDIWAALDREYEIVKVFPGTLGGGEVYVCRPREVEK